MDFSIFTRGVQSSPLPNFPQSFPSSRQLLMYFIFLYICLFWTSNVYMESHRMWPLYPLLSLSMFSGFIHLVVCILVLCSFQSGIIIYWIDIPCLVYPFISQWTSGMFPLMAIRNNVAMNICVHILGLMFSI